MFIARESRACRRARCVAVLIMAGVACTAAVAGTVTYETDPTTGRLTRATFSDGSYMTYTYDDNGNRTGAILTLAQDTAPPSAPSGLSANAPTQTQVNLSWNASTDNVGVTGYLLERCQGASCSNFVELAQPTGTSYSDSAVSVATTYRYRVRARDAEDNFSGYSNIASATPPDTTAPSPTGVPIFSNISGTEATVTVSAATDNVGVTAYEYSLNGGTTWTSAGGATSFGLSGLSSYVSYTVHVRARDAAGNRGSARSASFMTLDTVPPSTPASLNASPFSQSQIDLTWAESADNRGVAGYRVERCQGAGCSSFSEIAQPTGTSYSDPGRAPATSYSYRVRAIDATGLFSGYSNISSANTGDTSPPNAPGTPTFSSVAETSAIATWTAATDNVGVTSYEYSLNGVSWTTATSPLSLTGLTAATQYTLQVRARDAANNAGAVSSASFTTTDDTAPETPGTPSIGSITETSARATWTAATDNVGVTGYEYSLSGGTWTSATSPLNLTGLSAWTEYTLRIRARDAAGNRGSPSSVSFRTTDATAPSAPGTPTISSITETTATASWTTASDNVGVTNYQYSLNGGAWTTAASPLGLTGLSAWTDYTLRVRARDAAGNLGTPSSKTFKTADLTAPWSLGTPTFGSITGTSATASWSAATDNVGVTGYRYRLNGGSWANISGSPASLTGLAQATTYTFEVSARDAAGNWSTSKSASFTTADTSPPSAPGTPSFSSITHNSATAVWSPASDNVGVAGYRYRLNSGTWISHSSTSVTLSGLAAGTQYTLEVQARDAAGHWGNASSAAFTTAVQITITSRSIHTQFPGSATAAYVLTSGGDILTTGPTSNTMSDTGDWLAPKTGMANFQARATPISGTCSTGAMNTWVNLSTSPGWGRGIGGPFAQTVSCSFTLQIRHAANPSVILASATITLSARNQ